MNMKYEEVDLKKRFEAMGSQHPRLCTHTDSLPDLGDREAYLQALIREAHALVDVPVLERRMEGRRLLNISREALRRLSILSIAWMRTRDDTLLKRAESEMLAVCAFSDWNINHYLDTAEMSLAVSLGFDMLYNVLPESSRETIAEGLWRLGLETALDESQGWIKAHNNWGQVCHAGAAAAALVLAERHPEAAFTVLARAFRNIRIPIAEYAPDGVYPEGPMYWDYGTSFNVLFFILVESALGTSYDLDTMPGFVDSADYMRHATGPTGDYFNYADCRIGRRCFPALLWFADHDPKRFGGWKSDSFQAERDAVVNHPEHLLNNRVAPVTLLFGLKPIPGTPSNPPSLPLDMHGGGDSEMVTLRSAWNEETAWYVGVKSGTPSASHGHMDGGSFILEADGVRWGLECGMEDYNRLEQMGYNLWSREQDGLRWDVFRYGNLSHNIMVIHGERQRVDHHAKVVVADINVPSPYIKVDLSALYTRPVFREFYFKNRAGLEIVDTLSGLTEYKIVRWQMLTSATVSIRGNVLTLTQEDKTLEMANDADLEWDVTEADHLYREWDTPQENLRVVSFERRSPASGEMKNTVVFSLG